jgi:hypothetical protein
MDTGQNLAQIETPTAVDAEGAQKEKHLTWAQDQYITFCASSGISMTEDCQFELMTAKQFAAAVGYNRNTLYYWQENIPNFWQQVDQRARVIFNKSTKFAIIKGLKLKAMAGDVKAAEMLWSHFGDYTPPAQKHEVKINGWGDVVREARKKRIKANRPIEAEIVTSVSSSPALAVNDTVAAPPAAPAQPPQQPHHVPQPTIPPEGLNATPNV